MFVQKKWIVASSSSFKYLSIGNLAHFLFAYGFEKIERVLTFYYLLNSFLVAKFAAKIYLFDGLSLALLI